MLGPLFGAGVYRWVKRGCGSNVFAVPSLNVSKILTHRQAFPFITSLPPSTERMRRSNFRERKRTKELPLIQPNLNR